MVATTLVLDFLNVFVVEFIQYFYVASLSKAGSLFSSGFFEQKGIVIYQLGSMMVGETRI